MQPSQQQPQSSKSISSSSSSKWSTILLSSSSLSTRYDTLFIILLLIFEILVSYSIIQYIHYTEIDYHAYMEQCTIILQHKERDYYNIYGHTGPLVYPAGFVYIYSILQYITGYNIHYGIVGDTTSNNNNNNNNTNDTAIRTTQYLFMGIYILTQGFVLLIYKMSTIDMIRHYYNNNNNNNKSITTWSIIWKYRFVLCILCLSKRIHSIFILRLFNDGIAMFFFYVSLYCFIISSSSSTSSSIVKTYQYHIYMINIGCIFFSIAVSIKMNILLYAPGLFLLLLHVSNNWIHCLRRIIIYCGLPQILLGLPFLIQHPIHYIHKAFELDRIFFYKWTVNLKFLPEDVFVSKPLSIFLLLCHIGTLIYLAYKWIQSISLSSSSSSGISKDTTTTTRRPIFFINQNYRITDEKSNDAAGNDNDWLRLSPIYITSTMLTCNYIGIVFARTLHYQFYSWYFHAIPFLLFCNDIYNINDINDNIDPSSTISQVVRKPSQRQIRYFSYPFVIRIAILIGIEGAFLTYPATPYSSIILHISHLLILLQIRPPPYHLFLLRPSEERKNNNDTVDKKIN